MVKEIKRDYFLEQLIKREGNGLIKIVTGIRRCGKSYLLRTLFKNHLLENGVDEEVSDETLPDAAAGDETLPEETVGNEALPAESGEEDPDDPHI